MLKSGILEISTKDCKTRNLYLQFQDFQIDHPVYRLRGISRGFLYNLTLKGNIKVWNMDNFN